MSSTISPLTTNNIDQLTNKSPTDELLQLLIKQFLNQNKSIIEGNQYLIDEIRKLRELLTKQTVILFIFEN